MCPVSKFDKKIPKGSVPNWRLQICNCYGNRWCKCQLKPPKTNICPKKKFFWKKKKKKKKNFFFCLVIMAAPMPAAILEFRPKFGNSGLNISAPRAPTAKRLIYSESVDQCHSNAPQLVHFGQVLGKLNFSSVPPSPAANMRLKKKNLTYSGSVDLARQYQMVIVKIDH